MEANEEKKLMPPKEEKALPEPNEKLLRAPTFIEKYSLVKVIGAISILIVILTIGVVFAPSRFKADSGNNNINILVTPIQENPISDDGSYLSWNTYASENGGYMIEYPQDHALNEKKDLSGAVEITTKNAPGGFFGMTIENELLQGDLTLDQIMKSKPLCEPEDSQSTVDSLINNKIPAKIFTELNCLSYGKTLIRAVSSNGTNTMLYSFNIDSPVPLSEFKNHLDKLMSTFTVINDDIMNDEISTPTPGDEAVFCTMDAMQCPDGTWVGRSGPNCEFACPVADVSNNVEDQVQGM